MSNQLPNLWVVRGNFGQYTHAFLTGGYCGIGWLPEVDLSDRPAKDRITDIFRNTFPAIQSIAVISNQVGQINRFVHEVKVGDTIIVPDGDNKRLFYGTVESEIYDTPQPADGCQYRHRRRIHWATQPIIRQELSIPLQNTLRSSLTIFAVSQKEEFHSKVGIYVTPPKQSYDPYETVLEQLLQLSAADFEFLVGHLLTALGFDGSEVTGKSGDGGIDAKGTLNVSGLATMNFYVQAKRYKRGTKISANIVKQLRSSIPNHAYGAFITTADYQKAAYDVASENGFPPIGLINGHQLVDLLVAHWIEIPPEFRDQLNLRPGLVLVN